MSAPKLTCLCGAISHPIPVSLPAQTELCYCNPCRRITGALFASFVELPQASDEATLAKCTVYHSSATHDRLFCSTCGTKVVVHNHHHPDGKERNAWFAYSGAVERPEGEEQSNIVRPETNEWIDDAVDGGLAPYMTKLGGRDVPAYRIMQSDPPLSQTEIEKRGNRNSTIQSKDTSPSQGDRLKAECRCGAVSLLIKPADNTDKSIAKLDRFIPFTPSGEKFMHKYQARTCVCRSCRLAMGASLTTHTYIPPPQILNPHTGEPLAYAHATETSEGQAANRGLEALKHFWSSKEACRSFCGTCGSTVFYWNENRKEIVNISVGILRAEEGSLARRWFYWQPGMVSWKDEAVDKNILEAYMKADVN